DQCQPYILTPASDEVLVAHPAFALAAWDGMQGEAETRSKPRKKEMQAWEAVVGDQYLTAVKMMSGQGAYKAVERGGHVLGGGEGSFPGADQFAPQRD